MAGGGVCGCDGGDGAKDEGGVQGEAGGAAGGGDTWRGSYNNQNVGLIRMRGDTA